VVQDAFSRFLNQNPEVAQKLCEMAIENARRRLKEAAKVVRRKVGAGPALPGKLTDCISQNPDESELFMVEGDSAGGSAKQARDKNTQAVLPLRGKILNAWEEESGSILQSKEIHDIAVAIGVDPGSSDLRYSGDSWQFNWQSKYPVGDPKAGQPLPRGCYEITVTLTKECEGKSDGPFKVYLK